MKTLLCAAVKLENKYIEEWVRFYQKIGIDKIVIYDNNDDDTELITDVPYVKKLVDEGYIDVYLHPGKMGMQTSEYTECYNVYYQDYDWLMFFDIDEYLMFKNTDNIKEYLSQEKFEPFDIIHIQWKLYDDNDLVRVENGNYSLLERFTRPLDLDELLGKDINNCQSYLYHKTILRGRQYKRVRFYSGNTHTPSGLHSDASLRACNANGKEVLPFVMFHNFLRESDAWLNHYICKTAEEFFTNKMVRLCGSTPSKKLEEKRVNLGMFMQYNTLTFEKLKYFNEVCPEKLQDLLKKVTHACALYVYLEQENQKLLSMPGYNTNKSRKIIFDEHFGPEYTIYANDKDIPK